MRIALITEAWKPQANGVVTTWSQVTSHLAGEGHHVDVIHPGDFACLSMPGYNEVQLTLRPGPRVSRTIDELKPDAIHIATEGPLGLAARNHCLRRGLSFTTSYHTQFPDYLWKYFRVPRDWTYGYLRWFHKPAKATLIPTASLGERLIKRGFEHLVVWTRGVDHELFKPIAHSALGGDEPVILYAGRVAREKNIEAFLRAELPGRKVVMGRGPAAAKLQRRYPDATFLGYQPTDAFARYMASASVFVFPSLTDTFGVVMLEAIACGTPVAAYPVTGPIDVIQQGITGILHTDIAQAATEALQLNRAACVNGAKQFTWQRCAEMVEQTLVPVRP